MDVSIYLHGKPIASIFDLLGRKENDITCSIGWALARSPVLRHAMLARVFPEARRLDVTQVRLQEHQGEQGITDIELVGPDLHIIIEAKRGWQVPNTIQLGKYAQRLTNKRWMRIVAMSECSPEYARIHLAESPQGIPVVHIGWSEVHRFALPNKGTHAEKRLLRELRTYIAGFVMIQNQQSNLVYVVALGAGHIGKSSLTWIDAVERLGIYFHPVGRSGWPKEPPIYMGFRYRGRLQRIYHVSASSVIDDLSEADPVLGSWKLNGPHFLYRLGPLITPPRDVKGGKIVMNTRVWAMLDLLLTCRTLSDASDETKARLRSSRES